MSQVQPAAWAVEIVYDARGVSAAGYGTCKASARSTNKVSSSGRNGLPSASPISAARKPVQSM